MKWFQVLLVWLTCAVAYGDIDVKPQYDVHEPIVATVTITDVPEGAKLRGSLAVSDGSYLPAGENVFHVWAAPGKHTITSQGVWVLTKDVTVGDQTFPVLIDFGQYNYTKSFIVGEGDVVPPPGPPTPPGVRRAVILEETSNRTPAFALLKQQLLKEFLPERMQILDDDLAAALQYLPLAKPDVRPVLLVLVGDKLVRAVPCPASVDGVKEEVAK
jgi:hypothetical protein